VACIAAWGVAAIAQEALPTFRSGTTLVEFTFVAIDGKGDPVTDLKKEDVGCVIVVNQEILHFFDSMATLWLHRASS
jgi:hypothetical protein